MSFTQELKGILLLLSGILLCLAQAEVHYYDFVLRERNFTKLCETTTVLTVNDSLPGPEIRVRKGDTVYVNVHNQGDYGVTLHWHGVKQPRNPWSDGPEFITQCPIEPGTNFTYEIDFTTEEGTLWWHAHSEWTRVTVYGAIIILPAVGSTYPFPAPDGEETLLIGSWYIDDIWQEVLKSLENGSDTPISDAYTFNGEPGDLSDCSSETTIRLMVDYGKTYLLRIINAAINAEMFLAIAEHNMTVVGADGAYLKPLTTSYIVISPGQTMDVLVTSNQRRSCYYIAARQFWSNRGYITYYDHANVTAILQYSGNYTPPSSPMFPTDTLPGYQGFSAAKSFTESLRSLASQDYPVDVPKNITTRMYITAGMNLMFCPNASCGSLFGDRLKSSLNNMTFENPGIDVLQAYYRNLSGVYTTDFPDLPPNIYNFTGVDTTPNATFPQPGTRAKVVKYMEQVEIVFQGTNGLNASEAHPMHLHGHSFYFVGSGLGNFNETSDPESFNLIDPPQVNTVSVPKIGWAAIRFVANNPGVWFLHCHVEKHLTWGMDTVLIVKNGGTAETSMRPPPSYMPPCKASLVGFLHALNVSDEKSLI